MSLVSPDSDSRLNGPNGMLALQIVARGRSSMINWLSTVTWCLTWCYLYHLVPSCTILYRLRCFKQDTGTIRIRDSDPKATSIIYRFKVLCPRATRTCTSLANFIGWTNNIQNEVVDSLQVFIRHSFRIIMHNIGNWFVAPVCRPTEVRTVCVVPDQDVREAAEGSYETHPNLRFTFQWFSMHYAFQLSTFHRWCCGPPWATTGHHRPPWALQGAQRAKIARGATGPGACADNAHSCLSCVDSLLRQQAWQIFLAKCSLVDWSMMYWYSVLPHSMLSMLILNRIWLPEAKKDSAKLWQDVGIKNQNGFYENDWKEMKRVGE